MSRRSRAADAEQAREALRRRLYGADAGQGDLDAYRAAGGVAAPVDEPGAGERRRRLRRPRPLPALVVLAALVVAAVGLAVVVSQRPAPPAPATIAVDGPTRQGFVDALRSGAYAGIAAYLVVHPSPPALRSATRFTTVELHGAGDATLRLSPPALGQQRGRATVLLVLGDAAPVTWTASADGRSLASRGSTQQAGQLTTATFAYPRGARPATLTIAAPAGVPWGVAVVYSD